MSNDKLNKYQSLEKNIEELKKTMLHDIVNDTTLSKIEKLQLISKNNLFIKGGNVEEVFMKYYDNFKKIINTNPKYIEEYSKYGNWDPTIDDYLVIRGYSRHEVINLANIAKSIENNMNKEVVILTNRCSTDVYKISAHEFIDCVYEWCITNEMVSFENDW